MGLGVLDGPAIARDSAMFLEKNSIRTLGTTPLLLCISVDEAQSTNQPQNQTGVMKIKSSAIFSLAIPRCRPAGGSDCEERRLRELLRRDVKYPVTVQ